MDNISSTSDSGGLEPNAIRFTNSYVRRLLAERHHIRAKLENPGGSIVLRASTLIDGQPREDYSSQIGNNFHLDLIEIEDQLSEIPKDQVESLLTHMDGMNSQQAAYYLNARGGVTIRQRRKRAIDRLVGKLNGQRAEGVEGAGRGSNRDSETGRKVQQDDAL